MRDFSTTLRRALAAAGVAVAIAATLIPYSQTLAGEANTALVTVPLMTVDWQGPHSLPLRFRNHCRYDARHQQWYCANHCGLDFQFYFCSAGSFGCCKPGYGYCDRRGHLRCAP